MGNIGSYSIGVFIVVFIAGCIVNLLKNHFVIQLAGIAFFFTYSVLRGYYAVNVYADLSLNTLYLMILPMLAGISACLISMLLGFWIFPPIRRKFKD